MGKRVAAALKLESVGGISVNPIPESRLVDLSYTDSDPTRAQKITNAYADAFIAPISTSASRRMKTQRCFSKTRSSN